MKLNVNSLIAELTPANIAIGFEVCNLYKGCVLVVAKYTI